MPLTRSKKSRGSPKTDSAVGAHGDRPAAKRDGDTVLDLETAPPVAISKNMCESPSTGSAKEPHGDRPAAKRKQRDDDDDDDVIVLETAPPMFRRKDRHNSTSTKEAHGDRAAAKRQHRDGDVVAEQTAPPVATAYPNVHAEQTLKQLVDLNRQILETLKSVDSRLARIEHQENNGNLAQRRGSRGQSQSCFVRGSWKFQVDVSTGSFGKSEGGGLELKGMDYVFDRAHTQEFITAISTTGGYTSLLGGPPCWSHEYKVRERLPRLSFNGKAELQKKSGIYELKILYNSKHEFCEAGIIVGEVQFNNKGFVVAEGADWDRLLNNQRQMQLPYAHGARGLPTWTSRKISEPWKDGDIITVWIDTNDNTIGFQKAKTATKHFRNVLAFANDAKYPEFLSVYAYCGYGWQNKLCNGSDIIKLTIIT